MERKEFQQNVVETFDRFVDELAITREKAKKIDAANAGETDPDLIRTYDWPKKAWEAMPSPLGSYISRKDGIGRDVPAICFKVPTGGGKTYLAAECAARLILNLSGKNTGLVLWIVPTEAIFTQTLAHLENREHPYRQILDRAAAGAGNVRILQKDSPLHARDLEANLCVMVLMLQSARRTDKQTLRFFRDRGDVHGFLPAADDLPAHEALLGQIPNLGRIGELLDEDNYFQGLIVRNSLGNALRICRPIVVMDEGHYGYTKLAKETIYGLNPSFVLELTATPSDEANVLVNVSGSALEREEMIKMPINVTVDEASLDWRDTLRKAWDQIQTLQLEADRLQANTDRYIRPILLVQVERTGKDQLESGLIHAKTVREFLQGLGIGEDEIAEKTSDTDELKKFPTGTLLNPECPVRVIITKQALQEGWDCPFAYVLCSLAASTNQRSLTQLVGRILRQPSAKKTGIAALDECYVYCHHASTGDVITAIREGLEKDGMGDLADRLNINGGNLPTGKTRALLTPLMTKAHARVYFPKVLWVEDGKETRDLDYERDILAAIDWLDYETPSFLDVASNARRSRFTRIGLGVLKGAAPESREVDEAPKFDPVYATRAITDFVPNPWVARGIVGDIIDDFRDRYGDLDQLGACAGEVITALRDALSRAQIEKAEEVFRRELATGRIQFRLRTDSHVWKLPERLSVLLPEDARKLRRSDDSDLQKSVFTVYEHELNSLEKGVARYLDENAAVEWWHRNVARGQGYGLQGWKRHRVYPDILVGIEKNDKPVGFLAIETKGDQLDGNLDTEYKRNLFETLTKEFAFEDVPSVGGMDIEISSETTFSADLVLVSNWQSRIDRLLGVETAPATSKQEWLSASTLRNWCEGEPVLDWFNLFGEENGYQKDDKRPDYREDLDMGVFVRSKGSAFESAVLKLISENVHVESGSFREDEGWQIGLERTLGLMKSGVDAIYQGVVADETRMLWGKPDLLVRSDRIAKFIDEFEVPAGGAPSIGHESFHYVPIDIKFKSFKLLKSEELGASERSKRVQVAVYALALESMQGFLPTKGYLLGRSVTKHGEERTDPSCFKRLAQVSTSLVLGDLQQAVDWARRVRTEGRNWSPLSSTMVEMQINMSNREDFPWHSAKRELARTYRPLTELWEVTPRLIGPLLSEGVRSWTPDLAVERLGLGGGKGEILRQILGAQRPGYKCTPPSSVQAGREVWGEPADIEFFVDFETVSSLDDDFTALPTPGGSPRIFMVGCGHVELGEWVFREFTADSLSADEERRILRDWVSYMDGTRRRLAPQVEEPLVFHWSQAEKSFLSSAYNSAIERLGGTWPNVQWYDLLSEVVKAEPFVVHGALGFGLKPIAKSLHALGLIETNWENSPMDGLAAMIGAWRCDAEARAAGVRMSDLPLMHQIRAYNEVDCKVMMEILRLLRS